MHNSKYYEPLFRLSSPVYTHTQMMSTCISASDMIMLSTSHKHENEIYAERRKQTITLLRSGLKDAYAGVPISVGFFI